MKKNYLFLTLFTVLSPNLFSQDKKPTLSVGLGISTPAYFDLPGEHSNATGIDFTIQRNQFITHKLSWTAGLGINYFIGTYHYTNYMGTAGDSTAKNFAVLPLMAGLRYYFSSRFYFSGEAGLAIKASSNTGTHLAVAPSAGMLLPVKKSQVDISIRLMNVIEGGGIPEHNGLQKGGYGYWSFRVAWTFRHAKAK